MIRLISTILAAGLAGVWGSPAPAAAAESTKPNIIMILADDLGWKDTSLTGSTLYDTPHIERLAKRGMVFSNAYAASPLCSPTRSSIFTGMSPARTGFTNPEGHLEPVRLEPAAEDRGPAVRRSTNCISVTRLDTNYYGLAEALGDAGYATGHFGKWHLGRPPYSPLEHGFDVDIPHWPGPGPAGSFVAPWRFPTFTARTPNEHIEDRMGDEAVAFITNHKDRPFYLNYWQFSVHAPFDAKQEYIDEYAPRIDPADPQRSPTYAAMVRSLDDNVGKILDSLETLGIAENTIVIFYSDNGGNMYDRVDHTTPTSNAPLRGGKATIYEGGIRVPAIVVWPGVVAPGSHTTALVQSEDLYPTVLAMAGAPAKKEQPCDGISFLPVLRGQDPLREAVYGYFPHSPTVPDWSPPSVCVRKGDWKLIRLFHDGPDQSHRYELYNLENDIGEQNNRAGAEPERVKELDALLDRFLRDTGAVTPRPNPGYDAAAPSASGGWQVADGGRGLLTFNRRMQTGQIRIFAGEVMLTPSDPIDLPAGDYTFRVRMESFSRRGDGYVSVGETRVPIRTIHDRHLHNYAARIHWPGGSQRLGFSPCSRPGTTQIQWIELIDPDGKTARRWDFGASRPGKRGRGKA